MEEKGIINRQIASALSKQGHGDLLMVVDAGFAIPIEIDVIDVSIGENKPMVLEVLAELKKFFSVEKMIVAIQTKQISPTFFKNILNSFEEEIKTETIEHAELREMSKTVKTIIRTGDFTAYGNVILVSGAGKRWYCENEMIK